MSYPQTARHLQPVNAGAAPVHEPSPLETVNPAELYTRRVRLTPAAGIRLRPTFWLWDERIPAGAISLGPGREGIGKSLFCAWLAAQVTNGTLPGVHHGAAHGVVYAATEDSWERTIAGRLKVAGADLDRVYRVEAETVTGATVPLSLPKDCATLAEEITARGVALLICDPLISVVDSSINPNTEGLREALEPLGKLANDTGAAVFGLAHFNKSSGTDVLSRITGSRAFSAVSRAVMAFARDTGRDDGSCVISQIKNNLGRLDLPSLRYEVESVTLDTDEGPAEWGRLNITGETTTHVEQLLDDAPESRKDDDREEIAQWLIDYLADKDGDVQMTTVIDAGNALCGYSKDQLKRAKKDAGIASRKVGHSWYWQLPPDQSRERPSKGAGQP